MKPLKLTEIADRITAHLKRFERDPVINKLNKWDAKPYYNAHAWRGGAYVRIRYVSYRGTTSLRRAEAIAYLEWLDAGNVGRHFEFQRNEV